MKKQIKELGLIVALGAAGVGAALGMIKLDESRNPMAYAPSGYVVVQEGDSIEGLYKKEGWSQKEIRAFSPSNRNIYPGNVVGVPQNPNGDDTRLGDSERIVYGTREEAEEMRKQISAYGF